MDIPHAELLAQVDERSKHNASMIEDLSKGLCDLEKRQDNLDDLVSTVKVLAIKEERVESDVKEIKADVKALTNLPAQRWNGLIDKAIWAVAAAVIGYILAHVGL